MPIQTVANRHRVLGGNHASSDCSRSVSFSCISRRMLLIAVASLAATTVAFAPAAHAERKNVKISLDWIVQSTHAPFFIAKEKGYFKDAGVTVDALDPGKGATNVAISVASGAYDFGWVDMPSMINFNSKNPNNQLIAVYISFDASPLAVIANAAAGIKTPADLNGKKMAGGTGGAGHDTIGILLKAAKAENVKIDWVPVQPQLYGAMIKRGEVAGTIAFLNSNVPALLAVGMKPSEITVLKYSDYGADMYGLTLVVTKKFLKENPETVRGVVKALNHGTKDTIADPAGALAFMKKLDPMMKMDIEKIRLDLALELTDTKHVKLYGLSTVDPKKLQFTIDAIADAYDLKPRPKSEDVYTAAYLPPVAERQLAASK